ncbi:ABC transporter substrate-binding protein [Streptomyces cellostaticus]|uniref:ABC transporter substrate-binding protein n=1 Tax=Streptomyces cellostaticus TaxID=67285 RepID=A0A124HBY8_9ACTN|nr:extracellular solute-binding protein [Streptomyces cellostaticus]KUM92766.1 ABC transporter substrate-binding protein [Streptomyces cellostaticus]GHI06812.1 solute-binding protein [Streptomyces cellostaticus]
MVSALGMTAVLGGCGSTGSSDVTLKLVAADYGDSAASSSQKYWDKLAKEYESQHSGVKVEVSVYSWNDVDAKVKEMVDAGHAPDLAQIGAYADYAAADKLYPASDLLSIRTQADFLSQLADAGEWKHVQYGIPFAASTRVLFYNKTLFAKAGIAPPTTWSELAADAKALKDKGVKYPYALPLGPEEAQAETMQWLLSGGNGYTDDIGTYTIDSAQNVQTFSWLKDELVGKGLTGPVAPGKLNRAAAFAAFADGQVGMLNGHPTLIQQAGKKGVQFGMVPMPGRTGKAKAAMGVTDWMMGFKQNGHAKQIGDFLDFVYSEKNVLAFSHEYGLLPVTGSASNTMSDSGSAQDKDLHPFLDQLPTSQLYPVGKTSWAAVSVAVKKDIGQAVAPDGSPSGILTRLQATATTADSGSASAG